MTRRQFTPLIGLALIATLAAPALASAQDTKPGELWITLKGNDYAKPYLDNQEYEDHEFEKNGTKLIIRIEDRSKPYTFELRPSLDGFVPVTITSVPKKFRAKRVSGSRERRMVYSAKAKFVKAKPAADK